jgi:hypothetical protein
MSFVLLIQAAVTEAARAGFDLQALITAFAGMVFAGFWREIHLFKQAVSAWQSKIDTHLFGAAGNNGLTGAVKDHEERIRDIEHHDV